MARVKAKLRSWGSALAKAFNEYGHKRARHQLDILGYEYNTETEQYEKKGL